MSDMLTNYKTKIALDFPNLSLKSLKLIGSGWHHDAVEINNEIVFRIPRFDHVSDITSESVGYETAVLKMLKNKLPVAIPDPKFVASDKSYFGYPKLSGELLADHWSRISNSNQQSIINQWTGVIAAIQAAIKADTAKAVGVPLFYDPNKPLNHSIKKLYKIDEFESYIYQFADFVSETSMTIDCVNNTFIHNDLHLFNILINPKTYTLTGVIDWTDVCIGPLEREFCAWEWDKSDSLEKAVELYYKKTNKLVDIKQARFWKHLETITDLIEAHEVSDKKKINESLEIIDYWVKRNE